MKKGLSDEKSKYRAGLVREVVRMENNQGRKIDKYVYFVATAGHSLSYYISDYRANLKKGTLVIYIPTTNDDHKIEYIYPVTRENCFDNVSKGDKPLSWHNLSDIDHSRITANELSVYTYTTHLKDRIDEGGVSFEYSNWNIYHKDISGNEIVGYLPVIQDNALISIHFKILDLLKDINSSEEYRGYDGDIYIPHTPQLPFTESEYFTILYEKYKELKQTVDNTDIEDICNNLKFYIKTEYYTKVGGDDTMYVHVERNEDERVDLFISQYIKHNIESIKEKGYCNLYSCVDFKEIERQAKEAEIECKERLLRMYNPEEHLSFLLYQNLKELIVDSYRPIIRNYQKSLLIKEYRIWIAQHFTTYSVPYYYHYIKSEEDLQAKVYRRNKQ